MFLPPGRSSVSQGPGTGLPEDYLLAAACAARYISLQGLHPETCRAEQQFRPGAPPYPTAFCAVISGSFNFPG